MLRTKQLFFADVFPEGLQLYFIKKKLKHRCFPVNNAKFFRTAVFTEHLCWLLLHLILIYFCNFFFTRGDFNLILNEIEGRILKKFDQTELMKQSRVKFCCIHYQIYFIQ